MLHWLLPSFCTNGAKKSDMKESPDQNIRPFEAATIVFITFMIFFFSAVLLGLLGVNKSALLIAELLVILPALFYVKLRNLPFRSVFRFFSLTLRQWLWIIVMSFSAFVVLDELDRLVMSFFPMPQVIFEAIRTSMQIHSLYDAVVLFLAAVVMAGLGEEMLFRGFFQGALENHLDPARGIVMSAIAFALLHINPWGALQITVIGLLLGYVVWKSQSLLPAVFIHMTNNFLSIILFNCNSAQLSWYSSELHVHFHWLLVSILFFIPACLAFNRECQKTTGGN